MYYLSLFKKLSTYFSYAYTNKNGMNLSSLDSVLNKGLIPSTIEVNQHFRSIKNRKIRLHLYIS